VPRMPAVVNYPRSSYMGVLLLACTTPGGRTRALIE
jgi:hypothetical protein